MRIMLISVLAVVAMIGVRTAEASCARSSGGFSPRSGTVMPSQGTVYLFAPTWALGGSDPSESTLESESDVVRFTTSIVASSEVYTVVRVDYVTSRPQLSVRWGNRVAATYPIGAAQANRATVVKVEHDESSWTCSHTNTINIGLEGNAIAYRLAWADGTSTMAPADHRLLWSYFRDGEEPSQQLIELGHLNCMGDNVDPARFAALRSFQLYALFADGSEQRFRPAAAMLHEGDVRLPDELLHTTATPLNAAEGRSPSASPVLVIVERRRSWSLLGGLLGSGAVMGGALVVLVLHRLRRRRRDHVPRY